jgi:hypothetical protein
MNVTRLSRGALVLLLLVCGLPCVGWAASTVTQVQSGTEDTWYTTATALASNAQVISASAIALTNPGHTGAYCTLAFPTAPSGTVAANTSITAWFSVSTDGGATYPDGDASIMPARPPDIIFPLRNVNTAQKVAVRIERMPVGFWKIIIRNDGTGVTINGTWTLKCRTHTLQFN